MSLRLQLTKNDVMKILQTGLDNIPLTKTYPDDKHEELLVRLKTYNWNVDEHRLRQDIEIELDKRLDQFKAELEDLRANPIRFKIYDVLSAGLSFSIRNLIREGLVSETENQINSCDPLKKSRKQQAFDMFERQKKQLLNSLKTDKIYIMDYVEKEKQRNRIISAISNLNLDSQNILFQNILFTDNSLARVLFSIESAISRIGYHVSVAKVSIGGQG
jgi:hypothetical protein